VRPFYWEIGDATARLASGSVGDAAPTAFDVMAIESASTWVYGAYVAELRAGTLSASDVQFLTLRSGFTGMAPLSCATAATVDTCLALGTNFTQDAAAIDKFFYNGGHMQQHAHDIGLGTLNAGGLTAEVASKIGEFGFAYTSPQPAGGISATPDSYAQFLRAILRGALQMATKLGTNAVCANPAACADALSTPIPPTETWHYSIGHWVEDDPTVGDGAFSSAGALGFYPWIDRSKTWYGVLGRQLPAQDVGYASAQCGRLIRKAWVTGVSP
jgi:CubicO group peptidase (beta-lactamase class C family)